MEHLLSKKLWSAIAIRAIKTFAQTAAGVIGSALLISEVDWLVVLSASALAALLSVLMNIGGLPEVPEEGDQD
jgi:uroporphyrinogen-III synthase